MNYQKIKNNFLIALLHFQREGDLFSLINMTKQEKEEDNIHLRAVKYGYQRPNGFSYKSIQYHYSKRLAEWEVVKEFLHAARNNKDAGLNHTTPFVLLQRKGSGIEDSIFTLSYEASFNYLDYVELLETRKNARNAFITAIIAITISIASMGISAYFSWKQIYAPTKMDSEQYRALLQTIENRQDKNIEVQPR